MKQLFVILLISNFCLAQTKQLDIEYNNSGVSKIHFVDNPEQAKNLALSDIQIGKIFVIIHSGNGPIVYLSDSIFENKYNLKFNELGCVGSKFAINYNYEIFEYLHETFGKKWTKEIRKDALGFKQWKKNRKKTNFKLK